MDIISHCREFLASASNLVHDVNKTGLRTKKTERAARNKKRAITDPVPGKAKRSKQRKISQEAGKEESHSALLQLQLPDEALQIEERWWDEAADEDEFLPGDKIIRRRSLLRLKGKAWVDDDSINRYFELISDRSMYDDKLPTVSTHNLRRA